MKDVDDRIDRSAEIIKAISRLTDKQKIAVLAAMLGYTQDETGKMMDTKQNTVSELLGRARNGLLKEYDK